WTRLAIRWRRSRPWSRPLRRAISRPARPPRSPRSSTSTCARWRRRHSRNAWINSNARPTCRHRGQRRRSMIMRSQQPVREAIPVLALLWSCYLPQASQRKAHKSGTNFEVACFSPVVYRAKGDEDSRQAAALLLLEARQRRILGRLPSPLWGGVGGGGRAARSRFTAPPPPRPPSLRFGRRPSPQGGGQGP